MLLVLPILNVGCGHCKKLQPELEEAANFLKKRDVKFAKINCDENKEFCETQGVRSYPTLRIAEKGEFIEYNGPRDTIGIVNYLEVFLREVVEQVTDKNLEEFNENKATLLTYLKSVDSIEYKVIYSLGKRHRPKVRFGVTTDPKIAAQYGITSAPGVALRTNYGQPETHVYNGALKSEDIDYFVNKESTPLMDEIDSSNYRKYHELKAPLAYFFYTSPADRSTLGSQIEQAAAPYKGKINFVYIDSVKFGNHASNLNLDQSFPAFVIHQLNGDLKYPFQGTINQSEIAKFLEDFSSNRLEPFFKTETPPADNNGPVKIVTGATYENIVQDKTKNVFLKLYAPWCGHCKTLAPIWDELGEKFQNSDDVVIAKIDMTLNNLPKTAGYSVSGFPTLKFIKAGTNTVVDYTGERNLDALTDFLNTQAGKASEASHQEL
jgi:protein disulfide-isomerase A1